jgi:membrane-associated protein
MHLFHSLLDIVMHLDVHLNDFTQAHGVMTYAVLAGIIFCETGLVVTPFLPGDSLLFAAGATSAVSGLALTPTLLLLFLWLAGCCGDSCNYWVGRYIGPRAFNFKHRWFNHERLVQAHQFYEKYGPRTIIIARFMPFVRTFAPFVAGIGDMPYPRFLTFSVAGNLLWVGIFVLGGYFFGSLGPVKKHFTLVIMAVILISLVPGFVEYLKHRRAARAAAPAPVDPS